MEKNSLEFCLFVGGTIAFMSGIAFESTFLFIGGAIVAMLAVILDDRDYDKYNKKYTDSGDSDSDIDGSDE